MSGKHDRSLDDEQSAKLLLTGPIVIRGLGRSVKDALRPGPPSRHRAFAADAEDVVGPTPVQAMLASGPTVPESGPSSAVTDAPPTRADADADAGVALSDDAGLPQTESADGLGEDRVDERPDDAESSHDAENRLEDEIESEEPSRSAGEASPDAEVHEAEVDAAAADGEPVVFERVEETAQPDESPDVGGDEVAAKDEQDEDRPEGTDTLAKDDSEQLPLAGDPTDRESASVDDAAVVADDEDRDDASAGAVENEHERPDAVVEPSADADASPAFEQQSLAGGDADEQLVEDAGIPEAEASEEAGGGYPQPELTDGSVEEAPDVDSQASEEPASDGDDPESAVGPQSDDVRSSVPDDLDATANETPEPEVEDSESFSASDEDEARDLATEEPADDGELIEASSIDDAPADRGAESDEFDLAADDSSGASDLADAPDEHEPLDQHADDHEAVPVDEAALDAAAAELLSPDAARDEAADDVDLGVEPAAIPDPVVAEFIGDRGWTTAEELYSRPITLPASGPAEPVEAVDESGIVDETSESAGASDDRTTSDDLRADEVEEAPEFEQERDPFDDAFLVPDELEQPGGPVVAEEASSSTEPELEDDPAESTDADEWASAEELLADAVIEPGPDAPPVDAGEAQEETSSAHAAETADGGTDDEPTAQHETDESVAAAELDDEAVTEPGQDAPLGPTAETATAAAVAAPAIVAAAAKAPSSRPSSTRPGGSGRPPRRPRPLRERFGREAIGIAVLVVLALVCGGLITAVVLKTQRDAAIAASEAANYTPPPLATPTPAVTGPAIAVIGDGTTSVAAQGVTTAEKWSALLGSSLDGTVSTDASSGRGYAAKGSSGGTFVQAAAKVPSNAKVVIVFGGAADANIAPLSLAKAATDTFSAVQKQAPDAKLIVVGPPISGGASDADLTQVRNTLRSAAAISKATWIDPIDAGWLPASKQSASSPSALKAEDEKTLASKMEAAVKKALG